MRNNKNLNEEIKRMKSLFGDDLLYGNLVDNFLVENIKGSLIMEQAKPIATFLDALLSSIKKTGKSKITSEVDGVRTVYQISSDGSTILKNGKKIDDLTKISSFLSDSLSNRIKSQINVITSSDDFLKKYLTNEGYNGISLEKHINDIIEDLFKQKLINEGTMSKFKNNLKGTGIFQSLNDIFFNNQSQKNFIESISSDIDFYKKYSEIYELFGSIPDLKIGFYKRFFDDGKIISDEYDNFITIVDIMKKFKGKELDEFGNEIGELIPWKSYFSDEGKLLLEYNKNGKTLKLVNRTGQDLPSKLKTELRNEINIIKDLNPNYNIKISNDGTITFTAKKLNSNEIKNIDTMINTKNISPSKRILSKEIPLKTKSLDFGVDNMLDDNLLSKSKDWYTNYYKQYITNFMKNSRSGISKLFNNPTLVKMRDVFTLKMSRFLDPTYLRKNGYIATESKGPSQIDGNWQYLMNSVWRVETPIKGTSVDNIFIKTDEESLLYGLEKGHIKPNLVKKDGWKKIFKDEFLKSYNIFRFGLKGEYRKIATDKLIRNYFIQIAAVTTPLEIARNWTYYKATVIKMWVETQLKSGEKFFKEQWEGAGVNPNSMLPLVKKSYENKCKDNIKENIISVFGNSGEAKFNTYFGEEGELKDITKINEVNPDPFEGEGYNDTDNLPKLQSVEYNINIKNIDGRQYNDFGEIKKEGDKYFLITIPIDGKIKKVPLNCTPDFDTFWIESWKDIYELKNNPDAMNKKMKEIGEDVDWEKFSEETFFTELEGVIDKITFETLTDGIESSLEKVKDVGENAEEYLQKKLPDGGTSGDMGEAGVFK